MAAESNTGPRREAVILVRIDNMDTLQTEGQRSIQFPLTDIGPQTIDEWVEAALDAAPSPIHSEEWNAY